MFNFGKKRDTKTASHSGSADVEFCNVLLRKSRETFGEKRVYEILHSAFEFRDMPESLSRRDLEFPDGTQSEILKVVVIGITNELVKAFGTDFTESILASSVDHLDARYKQDDIGAIVMPIIPAGFLEVRKVKYLSKEELEKQVALKTAELRKMNDVLEEKVLERTVELEKLLAEQSRSAELLMKRDVELTKANKELRELDERKSEFLSIVAHQLRTPLSGIKWTLSMIVNGELGGITADQKNFLQKSCESNERMITLVDDMLHADRINSGKYQLRLERTQVLGLIDGVLFDIRPTAMKRNVKIEFNRGTEPLPPAYIDSEKIRAVFQNLLDNAVKYSKPGGAVLISAGRDAGNLVFAVKDNGIGIPEDQKDYLFSRFFRARNALKVETDGSGLGLFIVKSIIERHGGRIWFESRENEGSTFYFTIKI